MKNYKISGDFGDVYAVYPHRNQTPVVKEFIKMVKNRVGSPAKWTEFTQIDNF